MANYFDRFDVASQPAAPNFFDKFDEHMVDPGTTADVVKSFAGGVGTGLGGIVDALNPVNAAKDLGKDFRALATGDLSKSAPASGMSTPAMDKMASLYTPKTTPGRYAFAAGTGVGGGSVAGPSAMMAGGVSGVASQGAGDLTSEVGKLATDVTGNPKYERFAETARPVVEAATGLAVGGKVIDWLRSPEKGTVETAGSVPEMASRARDILKEEHSSAKGAETQAWAKVDREAAGKSVPYSKIPEIQNVLMDAQASSGHPILGTQLATLNRFVDGGLDVPASTILTMRRALSKASSVDGGLREAVNGLDTILGDTLKVKSLDGALAASRDRFGKFVDQSAVAKTIADDTTPETVGKVLMSDKAQGANVFDQVIKAAGKQGEQAKEVMQQGIVHSLIQDARKNTNDEGVPILSKDALANNIFNLKNDNPTLWAKLDGYQDNLINLAKNLKQSQGGNPATRVVRFIWDNFIGHKVTAAQNLLGVGETVKASDQITLPKALDLLGQRPEKVWEGYQEHLNNLGGSLSKMPAQAQPKEEQDGPVQIPVTPSNMGNDGRTSLIEKIIQVESGGKPTAKASTSSAYGLAQMTKPTWLSLVKRYSPQVASTMPMSQILELRSDKEFASKMLNNLIDENSTILSAKNVEPSEGAIYLAHVVNPVYAASLIKADPKTPVNRILPPGVISANRNIFAGKKAGQVVAWANKLMST